MHMANSKNLPTVSTTAVQASAAGGTDKDRFDQCIAMLKGYYDAVESRFGQNVTAYLVALGWLLTSSTARTTLVNENAYYLALTVVGLMFLMYVFNIRHYLGRWREIRATLDALGYLPPGYYARYNLPSYTLFTYSLPVAVLAAFVVLLIHWSHIKAL